MKKVWPLILLLLFVNQASGIVYFNVKEPSSLNVTAGSDVNFTVAIKSLGNEGRYVHPTFRSVPEGVIVSYLGPRRWIDPGGTTEYICHLSTGEVPAGSYTFEIGVAAVGAPPSYQRVDLIVEGPGALESDGKSALAGTEQPEEPSTEIVGTAPEEVHAPEDATEEEPEAQEPGARAIPGFGAASMAAMILLRRRFFSADVSHARSSIAWSSCRAAVHVLSQLRCIGMWL